MNMKSLFVSIITSSLISLGCAHKNQKHTEPKLGSNCIGISHTSLKPAPKQIESKPVRSQLEIAEIKLRAYEAMSDLEDWLDKTPTFEGLDPMEDAIERARAAINVATDKLMEGQQSNRLWDRWFKVSHAIRLEGAKTALLVLRAFASKNIEVPGTAADAIAKANKAVTNASDFREKEEVVKALQTEFNELSVKARIAFAEIAVDRLQKCVDGKDRMFEDAVKYAEDAIVVAIRAGDDVSALTSRFQKLRTKACVIDKYLCVR